MHATLMWFINLSTFPGVAPLYNMLANSKIFPAGVSLMHVLVMNKFAIMVYFTTHCLSLSLLYCLSQERAAWSASAMDGRREYGGYSACFKRFLVGNPIESRYRTPSVTKQSASKCLEHSFECFEGPSQLLRCRFTARTHFACKSCSRGNPCKLYPSPLFVLYTQQQRNALA